MVLSDVSKILRDCVLFHSGSRPDSFVKRYLVHPGGNRAVVIEPFTLERQSSIYCRGMYAQPY